MAGFFSGDARADLHASFCTVDRGPGRRVLEKERSLHALWLRCMRRCLSHPGPLVANKPDSGCTAVRGCSLLFRLPTTLPKRE